MVELRLPYRKSKNYFSSKAVYNLPMGLSKETRLGLIERRPCPFDLFLSDSS